MSDNTAPTFASGTGIVTRPASGQASTLVVQDDGKILLGGNADGNFVVFRYNSDGSLDTSFGGGDGMAYDLTVGYDYGHSLAVQADGKILLGGHVDGNFALVRYTSTGVLDPSFGGGDGVVTTDLGYGDYAYSATVDADGKILLGGYSNGNLALIRYNSNGTLDSSFGGGDGIVTTDLGGGETGYSVTVLDDGSILLVGGGNSNFVMARYTSAGVLDTSFGGGDGFVIQDIGGTDYARSISVDADGNILLAGTTDGNFALARFTSSGVLDISFGGGDGIVTTDMESVGNGNSVTIDADGKILIGGRKATDFALVRYNSDGTLDTSFGGGDGIVITDLGSYEYALDMTIDADGKILLGGNSSEGFTIARYNSDGTLDTTFGAVNSLDGTPTYTAGGAAVVLDSDVKISDAELNGGNFDGATLTLARHGGANASDQFSGAGIVAGSASGNVTVSSTTIGTYTWTAGTLVITFNSDSSQSLINQAMQKLAYSNGSSTFFAGNVQVDWTFNDGNTGWQGTGGALAATGSTTVKVTSVNDAPVFTSLGDGKTTTDFGDSDYAYGVAVGADGKIVVAGVTNTLDTGNDFAVARYTKDGKLDTTFSSDGKVTTNFGSGAYDTAYGVLVQSSGKVVVAGTSGADFALARYTSTGALDSTFGTGGKVTTDFGQSDFGYSLYQQADGKFIVAGYTSDFNTLYDFAAARYNADGALDTNFGTNGKLTSGLAGEDYARAITVDANGNIIFAGNNGTDFLLAYYNNDGTINTNFGTDGVTITDFGNTDSAWGVATQTDGKILVAGVSGDDFALARYNLDGSLDTDFSDDGKVTTDFAAGSDWGKSVVVQTDGRILVAGSAFNGTDSDFAIARYNSDGSLDASFGNDGLVMTDFGANDGAESITLQANGKIVVAGRTSDGSTDTFALLRYNSNGTLDTTFDSSTTLSGAPTFKHGGSAVVLDNTISLFDAELAARNNYAGATLTLMRSGGASVDDRFSGAGNPGTTASGNVVVSSVTIGTYTWTAGKLVMTFNSNATEARVEQAMQGISYSNVGAYKSASIKIDWTFSDGNTGSQGTGGALTATGSTTVKITANTLNGTSAANTLNGSATTDVINGLAGNDTLKGNAGHDILNGGVGKDSLTGGTGKDIFLFDTTLNISTNLDTITDFKAVDDTIRLDKSIFGKLTIGKLAAANFKANTTGKAADLNDYIVYETDTGKLFYDADGSGSAKAAIQFATLVGKPTISAADFDIIA